MQIHRPHPILPRLLHQRLNKPRSNPLPSQFRLHKQPHHLHDIRGIVEGEFGEGKPAVVFAVGNDAGDGGCGGGGEEQAAVGVGLGCFEGGVVGVWFGGFGAEEGFPGCEGGGVD